MSSKYVYLKAYLQKNLGDDMFVRCLAMRYPNVKFITYADKNNASALSDLKNINLVPAPLFFCDRVLYKLFKKRFWKLFFEKKAMAVVHIGGSIFIEPSNFKKPRNFYYPSQMYYIGCNFGPYHSKSYFDFIKTRMQKASDVCFRDKESYNLFSDLKNMRVAPDVLFGYNAYPKIQKGDGIGISVINLENRQGLKEQANRYYTAIANLIDDCFEKGIKVSLIGFCCTEGDEKAISNILSISKHKDVEMVLYDGDIEKILSVINECEYIIASRFHAMIIGWCMRKKVFPIIYSHKQTAVMEDVQYRGKYWDLKDTAYDTKHLFSDCLESVPFLNLSNVISQAQDQFKGFDDYTQKLKVKGEK